MHLSAWPDLSWDVGDVLDAARRAEALGFHGVWVADHYLPNTGDETPADGPVLECWSVLAALAVATERVRLGSLVTSVTFRNPGVLAKTAATVDRISAGRLVLGVGAGWQLNEHAAYGLPLGAVPERIERLAEAVAVLRGLLSQPRTTAVGRHYRVVDAPCDPPPLQSPLPLLVGAKGERRMLPLVARLADEWNCWSSPEVFRAKSAVLDHACEDIGRDPASIRRTTQAPVHLPGDLPPDESRASLVGPPEAVAQQLAEYAAAGCDEFIVPLGDRSPQQARELLERLSAEVRPLVP